MIKTPPHCYPKVKGLQVWVVFNIATATLSTIEKALRSTSIRYRSDAKASDRCLIDVDQRAFAIWNVVEIECTITTLNNRIQFKPNSQQCGCYTTLRMLLWSLCDELNWNSIATFKSNSILRVHEASAVCSCSYISFWLQSNNSLFTQQCLSNGEVPFFITRRTESKPVQRNTYVYDSRVVECSCDKTLTDLNPFQATG